MWTFWALPTTIYCGKNAKIRKTTQYIVMDFWLDLGISAVLSALRQSVKNAQRKAELKRAMYKIWSQIGFVYPEFVDGSYPEAPTKNSVL